MHRKLKSPRLQSFAKPLQRHTISFPRLHHVSAKQQFVLQPWITPFGVESNCLLIGGGLLGGLGDTVGKTVGGVTNTVGDTVGGLGNTVGGATGGLGQTVSGATEGLGNTTKSTGQGIQDGVQSVGGQKQTAENPLGLNKS